MCRENAPGTSTATLSDISDPAALTDSSGEAENCPRRAITMLEAEHDGSCLLRLTLVQSTARHTSLGEVLHSSLAGTRYLFTLRQSTSAIPQIQIACAMPSRRSRFTLRTSGVRAIDSVHLIVVKTPRIGSGLGSVGRKKHAFGSNRFLERLRLDSLGAQRRAHCRRQERYSYTDSK